MTREVRERHATVWITMQVPPEIANRVSRVVFVANSRRLPAQSPVSKSGFMRACLVDGLTRAEKGLGIE